MGESLCEKIKENWGAKSHWEKYIKIFLKWWKRRWTETQVLHVNLHVKGKKKYKFEIIIEFYLYFIEEVICIVQSTIQIISTWLGKTNVSSFLPWFPWHQLCILYFIILKNKPTRPERNILKISISYNNKCIWFRFGYICIWNSFPF